MVIQTKKVKGLTINIVAMAIEPSPHPILLPSSHPHPPHTHTHTHTARAEELRKDTEVMSQTFERVVDRKDAIIRSLVKDLEEAEEQYPPLLAL